MEDSHPSKSSLWTNPFRQVRRIVSTAFGVTSDTRSATVSAMLTASLAESVGYWFQLVLSMAIATLGLVLNSSGVVIAAMLIAPLMGPIVQMGMALAIGSPILAIRALTRALLSIFVVVGSATLITLILPFYEVTPEIAARTSPTVLDLIVAGCCALAGAFATVRSGSDTAGTAAGTAIGIAQVPPLCVIGFGLGSSQPLIASGASLLFTANLCAILVFAVVMFLGLGFDQVNVAELEAASISTERGHKLTLTMARRLKGLIGSRYSTVLRIIMPLALLVGVYVPLRQALEEVTWQVRVRSAIQKILADSPVTRDAVRSVVDIEKNGVSVRLVVVAEGEEAARLEEALRTRIAAAAGVVPSLELVTVPDFSALQAAAGKWNRPTAPELPHGPELSQLRMRLASGLATSWPKDVVGPMIAWTLDLSKTGMPRAIILHLGPPLGAAGEALLSRAISTELGTHISITDVSLPTEKTLLQLDKPETWILTFIQVTEAIRGQEALTLRIQRPAGSRGAPDMGWLTSIVTSQLSTLAEKQVCWSVGEQWQFQLALEPCPPQPTLEAKSVEDTPRNPRDGRDSINKQQSKSTTSR